jgi:arylsulfatase A-like enzyme
MESGHRLRRVQNHAVYGAMVHSMDESVGRVMQALDDLALAENTVVVFFSDNGGLATSEGWPTSNLPLRAGKGWLYEGGIRVPMAVRGPGIAPGTTSNVPVISDDFFPTIMDLAGVDPSPHGPLDGRSLVPLLRQRGSLDRDTLYWHYPHYSNQGGRPGGAIRVGPYKLIEFFEDRQVALYDLNADPGEQQDLTMQLPDKVETLRQHLHAWRASIDAQMPAENPDYRAE